MRKKSYNFLERNEVWEKLNPSNLNTRVKAKNNENFTLFKKWTLLLLFGMVLSFSVKAQVDVTASGGTASASYTTLRSAFDAINAGTHTGTIAVSITASTTEPGMDSLVSSGTGSASYSSVVIKPATGVSPTITASHNGPVIKLVGADNVTIDGSNTIGGSTRDLAIKSTSTGTSVTGIWVASVSGNGATSNTIKNCNLTQSSVTSNWAAILSSSTAGLGTSAPTANSNNTYSNNLIGRTNYGILMLGASALDNNVNVNSNTIQDSIFLSCIYVSNQTGYNIYDNYISVTNTTAATTQIHGINIINASTNGNIYRNKIAKVYQYSGASSARGMTLQGSSANANINIYNNFIGDVWAVGISNSFSCYGIALTSANGGYKLYNNTINLTTALSNSGAVSAALFISGTTAASSLDIRNNIFRNVQAGGGSAYAFADLNPLTNLSFCDNNSYYSHLANINVYTSSQTAASTIPGIQALTGKDANSVLVNASFVSTTDLHLQLVAGNASLNNGGTPIGVVTTDIDGATRSVNYPDIGADEIVYTPKISGFTPSQACPGTTVTINGADFTGTSAVSLAGLSASSFSVVSTSQLTAVVASGATSGSNSAVTVTNGFGTATSASNLNRLADGTYTSKSISSGSVGDQVTIVGTNLSGITGLTFNGVTALYNITNATEIIATVPAGATTGNIIITDACGNAINAGSFTVVAANPCTSPSSQATNFVASSSSSSALNGTFTPASGNPSGYVVVYSTSALSSAPVDGQTYTAGAAFGGTIRQVSASNSVSLTGLTANTVYTVTIYSYNGGGCTGGPLYNTTSPLVYTFTTCSDVPTSVTATPVGNSSGNSINFSWGSPAGGGANSVTYSLEVTTDAAYSVPVSGSPFTTSQLSQSVSGLNFNTKYYYRIRSNNGCYSSYVSSNVTTACGAGNLPFAENFDATTTSALPTCWTNEDANGDGITWTSSNIDSRTTGLSNPRALRYLCNTVTTTTAANDWAFLPGVALVGGQSYTLSFLQSTVTNAGENLQVYYGSTASSAMKLNANKIYDEAGLTNRSAAYKTATFTPSASGTYYLGFYTNSPSNAGGGLYLFVDDIQLDVTPSAPASPAPVTTSNATAYSVQVNWSDNSSTEVGYYIYSSTDNVNWVLRNTVGNNVTSTVVSNLKANTTYYFKVAGYNGGGIGTGATSSGATTLTCGSYTTNSYIGTLFTGTGNNWNNAANWSQNRVPNACDDVQVNGTLPITTTCYLYLPNPVAIHNLTINQTLAGTAIQRLFLWTQDYSFDISGDVTVSNNRTGNTTVTGDAVYLVSGPGIMSIDGNVSMGVTGNRVSALGAGGASLGPIYLKGNVNFGDQAFLNFGNLINYVFDAPVSQTVTINSSITSATPSAYGLGAVTIGNTNSPVVTFTDTMVVNSTLSRVVGDLTINNGATLIINNGTSLNRTQGGGGTFTMGNNATLKISGATGGILNSNFPDSFATHSFANSSTVIFNGTSAQTIPSAPTYGNLTLNNSNGAVLNGTTTVNNVLNLTSGIISTNSNALVLGLSGSITGASATNYINGTLSKTKQADNFGFLNFEIGDATNYTPVFVGFNGLTNSGGIFSAKTTSGAPAGLGYLRSGISQTNYLNRTFTLTNNGVTGFTSIAPKFDFANSDFVGVNSNANYKVADSISGGGWSLRTTSATSSTSNQATNVTLPSGSSALYLLGELDPPPAPLVNEPNPTSACEGSSYVISGSNFYGVTSIMIGSTTVTGFTVNSSTQITITIPTGASTGTLSVSNSSGTATTTGDLTILSQPVTTVSVPTQTICSGDAIATIMLGNSGNISGTTYSWTRTGNNISGGSNASSGTTDITGTLVSSSTIPETITYTVNSLANGCVGTPATATVTLKASPGVVNVTPSNGSICQNNTEQLVANYTAATGSSTKNSGAINVAIPDNLVSGVNTTLNVNDVPSGAVVTKVEVGFSVNHTYVGDLALNVTAPNGKTLNLAYQAGAEGDNYVNTIITSDPFADPLPIDSTPGGITGTFAPDAFNNVGTVAYRSNTTDFTDLFSTPNGTWRFSARDYFAGDVGTITNWYVKIYYTLSPTFSWSKVGGGYAGLYTDAGFTPYSGGSQQTVYAKNTPGTYQYTANISFNGCTANSNVATVDVQAVPITTRTPSSQTVCSGTTITSIQVGASNDPSAVLSWTRDHTSDVTGIAGSGTGNITGALVNETSSPITVTFTITANGSGSQFCSGNTVTSTVTVNPTPLASATPLSQSACSGSAITPIIFGTTNGVSGTNYTWTRDNTSAATGIASSGTQFVSGTLTNASSQTTVTFNITAVGPGASACAGTPTTATVTVYNNATSYSVTGGGSYCSPGAGMPVGLTNSQSGYDYQLLLNGTPVGSPVNGNGSPISFGNQQASGTYTVLATNSGCSKPMNGSAVINAITTVTPTISIITSKTTICANTNATFFAVATNTGNNPTYNFKVNGFSVQSSSSKVYITSTLTDGDIVSCTLTSTNTCQTAAITNSNEITMTVNSSTTLAAPAAITGNTTICTVGSYSYLASTTTGGVWSSSDPSIASVVASGKVTAVANGTAIISYTISGSNGCTNSASAAVTVAENSAPASISGASTLCVGSSTTYSSATSGGVWSATAGRVTINSAGLATGTSAGNTAIRYTVTNAAGCSKYTDYPVTVGAKPAVPTISYASGTSNPQLGASGGFCINKTFTVVGTPSGGTWSSSNSSVFTVNAGGVVNTLALGTASLTYTYGSNGCSASRSIPGTVVNCAARGVDLSNMPKPELDFTLFPNPAKGLVSFNTEFAEAGGKIVLTDMFGKTIRIQALSLGTNTIDIGSISKGFYLVSVITTDGKKTKKLIIE